MKEEGRTSATLQLYLGDAPPVGTEKRPDLCAPLTSLDRFERHALFLSLSTSGCLSLISRERALDSQAMKEALRRFPIDCLKIAPSP